MSEIPVSEPTLQVVSTDAPEKWQQILADLVTDPKELLRFLDLDTTGQDLDPRVLHGFPLKVPRPFMARMEKGNWQDPLLRQVLPVDRELAAAGEIDAETDPLDEAGSNPLPGLLHKYQGRVLLTVAPHCAIHCRYCFRRHFDYRHNTPGRQAWQQVVDYIRQDRDIREVIYSGGDPLAASDRQLAWLTRELETIPHLQRLRIHSRTPVMIPQRVTDDLLQWLGCSRLRPVLVVHCNHAREIDAGVARAFARLRTEGITLLNQSVLLKGVNDKLSTLCELSERLFDTGVLPYYLHLLDPVQGTRHFEVSAAQGRRLIEGMSGCLSGYLVPRLVRELAGANSKLPVT